MKFLALFALFIVAASKNVPLNSKLDDQWENFKMKFGKKYDDQEEVSRRMTWERQLTDVIRHNLDYDLGLHSYRKSINKFSDMENEEFLKIYTGYRDDVNHVSNGSAFVMLLDAEVPDTVDWRDQGLVTPVKNQQQCGSCWAFSATGSLEGQNAKKTGQLVSLSEQNLVDCSGTEGAAGCGGGWMNQAFEYIKKNGGIDTEDSYPYTAQDGDCQFNPDNVGATVSGYVDIPCGDEEALKNAVATVGPISIAFDAGHESFQSYQSGIYDEPDCATDQFNHAVTIVGYGSEDGNDYWLMKNSWGEDWGDNGYIKMSRNKNNQCGVASKASYPTV